MKVERNKRKSLIIIYGLGREGDSKSSTKDLRRNMHSDRISREVQSTTRKPERLRKASAGSRITPCLWAKDLQNDAESLKGNMERSIEIIVYREPSLSLR